MTERGGALRRKGGLFVALFTRFGAFQRDPRGKQTSHEIRDEAKALVLQSCHCRPVAGMGRLSAEQFSGGASRSGKLIVPLECVSGQHSKPDKQFRETSISNRRKV